MPDKIKLIEFRDVGGLQNNNIAVTGAIYENLELLADAIDEIRGSLEPKEEEQKPKLGRPKKEDN